MECSKKETILLLADELLGKIICSNLTKEDKKKIIFIEGENTYVEVGGRTISIDMLMDNDAYAVWVANANYYQLEKWCYQIRHKGIETIRIFKSEIENIKKCEKIEKYSYIANVGYKALISKIEYHVCDHCNLNCRGCSHFAPLFDVQFADIKTFSDEMKLLSQKFENVFRFRLMGGEPFLNVELDKFIFIVRKYLPNTRLEIVTNGLLLNKVDAKVWNAIKANDAILNISLYPPTFKRKDSISAFLNQMSIKYTFGSGLEQYNDDGIIKEFHKNLTLDKSHNEWESTRRCMGAYCHFYRAGKLSKCALPQLIGRLENYFGVKYEVNDDDIIELQSDIEPWEIVERMRRPTSFCKYCSDVGTERFKWELVTAGEELDYYVLR